MARRVEVGRADRRKLQTRRLRRRGLEHPARMRSNEGMTSLSPWLKPTLLGPLLTLWTLTTIGSITVGMATLSGGRLDNWAIGMLWASFFGSALGVLAIAVDVLLLKLKWRSLPTGARAWIPSVLSPFGVAFIWSLPFLPPPETAVGAVLFISLPMVAATFVLRMMFGRRP